MIPGFQNLYPIWLLVPKALIGVDIDPLGGLRQVMQAAHIVQNVNTLIAVNFGLLRTLAER